MKKIISLIFMSLLLISFAFAATENAEDNQPIMNVVDGGNAPEATNGLNDNSNNNSNQEPELIQERVQERLRDGTHMMEGGQQLQVRANQGNMVQLQSGNSTANCRLNLTQEMVQNKLQIRTQLSNGRNAEIKVMPNTASENALNALRLHNCMETTGCSIELKEVNQGNQIRAAYELKTQKEAKVFGLFRTKMHVQAQIDAETGEVIRAQKAWWAFLASED